MTDARHEVVIIGGGIAGLAAAWELRDRDIVLLEAEERVGGRIASQRRDPYWLNVGAHLVGGPHTPVGRLAADLGVELIPIRGHVAAVHVNGKLTYGGPVETYPFRVRMSPAARLSFIQTGLRLWWANNRLRRYRIDPLHGVGEAGGLEVAVAGDSKLDSVTFADVLGPMHPEVTALMRSATNRLTAEPAEVSANFGAALVGNLWGSGHTRNYNAVGGTSEITDRLARQLGERVVTGARVGRVVAGGELAELEVHIGGGEQTMAGRSVIVATPAYVTREIIPDLPPDKASALEQVAYGPFVVMGMITSETGPMPYDDLYAVAVADKSFCMFFNMVNALRYVHPDRRAGGALMVYAGAQRARELMKRSDEEIHETFLNDVYSLFPETRGIVGETWVQRWEKAYPFWRPGRLGLQEALARPLNNLYFAGDYLDYASIDTAARSGILAARAVRRLLTGG